MLSVVKSFAVSYLGIIGGVLTLFSNLQGILDLANWAKWLAQAWGTYLVAAFHAVFGFIHLRTDVESTMMIAMAVFVAVIAIGARIEIELKESRKDHWPVSIRNVLRPEILVSLEIYLFIVLFIKYFVYIPAVWRFYAENYYLCLFLLTVIYGLAIVVGLWAWPLSASIPVALSMIVLSYVFNETSILRTEPPDVSATTSMAIALAFAIGSGLLVVIVAPPRAFVRRLIFVMAGVGTLVLLNVITNVGVTVLSPPNV